MLRIGCLAILVAGLAYQPALAQIYIEGRILGTNFRFIIEDPGPFRAQIGPPAIIESKRKVLPIPPVYPPVMPLAPPIPPDAIQRENSLPPPEPIDPRPPENPITKGDVQPPKVPYKPQGAIIQR